MIKDRFLQILFIPLLGMFIPYISGIVRYKSYSLSSLLLINLYFVFVSFCIWRGCSWLHMQIRRKSPIDLNPFKKIGAICISSILYSGIASGIFCFLWMKYSSDKFHWNSLLRFIVFSIMAALLFALMYEVIFLSKERERDNRIVDQLDNELNRIEMRALRNELDPHFIFNSLNTLSYLIGKDDDKAQQFNNKLAHVYKYFLVNKDKELIPLDTEMDFVENYTFLLQIRFDNTMQLDIDIKKEILNSTSIIPGSVQLLIENAIKHTQFTSADPLRIYISTEKNYLKVENTFRQKTVNNSTRIGLKNLNAQYMLVLNKSIIIEKNEKKFLVKLPLHKNAITV